MRDQASGIRTMVAARSTPVLERAAARSIVLGAGKGGSGVSLLSLLLASAFARRGRRVLLMDAALNQGNLHILLHRAPTVTLRALLAGEATPEDLLVPVGERLWLLPAESGAETVHALTPMDRARLHVRLAGLIDDFDLAVVDAGTGIEGVLGAVMVHATRVLTIATPEPAAIADAYALIKLLSLKAPALPVDLLVNRARDEAEAQGVFQLLSSATSRFLGRGIESLGALEEDARLANAVRDGKSLRGFDASMGRVADAIAARLGPFPMPGERAE